MPQKTIPSTKAKATDISDHFIYKKSLFCPKQQSHHTFLNTTSASEQQTMQVENGEDISSENREMLQTALSLTLLSRSTGPEMSEAKTDKEAGYFTGQVEENKSTGGILSPSKNSTPKQSSKQQYDDQCEGPCEETGSSLNQPMQSNARLLIGEKYEGNNYFWRHEECSLETNAHETARENDSGSASAKPFFKTYDPDCRIRCEQEHRLTATTLKIFDAIQNELMDAGVTSISSTSQSSSSRKRHRIQKNRLDGNYSFNYSKKAREKSKNSENDIHHCTARNSCEYTTQREDVSSISFAKKPFPTAENIISHGTKKNGITAKGVVNCHNSNKSNTDNWMDFVPYVDRSQQPDLEPDQPLTPPNRTTSFVAKLYIVLSIRPDLNNIIQWSPHGRAFRLVDPVEFELSVIPEYFGLMTLTSFYRKIKSFGFCRIKSEKSQHSSYFHEYFLRGRPWLFRCINKVNHRRTVAGVNGNKTNQGNSKFFEKNDQTSKSGEACENDFTEDDLIRANCINPLPTGSEALNNIYRSSLLLINDLILKQGPKAKISVGLCNIRFSQQTTEEENSASTFTSTVSFSRNASSVNCCVNDTNCESSPFTHINSKSSSSGSCPEKLHTHRCKASPPHTTLPRKTVANTSRNQMQQYQMNQILGAPADLNFIVSTRQQNQSQIPVHAISLEQLQRFFIPRQHHRDSFTISSGGLYQPQNQTTVEKKMKSTTGNILNAITNECQAQPSGTMTDRESSANPWILNIVSQLFQNQNALQQLSTPPQRQ